jgi:hypothetical protein
VNHSSFLPTPPKDPPEDARTFAFRQLRQRIQEISPLDEHDWALLEQKIRWETCPKGTLLLRPGEVSNHLRFMHVGAVIYYEHIDEEIQLEKVGWIARPSELVLEINSFFQRSPTLQFMRCTVPCTFLTLTYDDLQMLYAESPAWNTAGRRLFEDYMLLMAERMYFYQLNSAKEKYKYFTDRFPEATQLVSLRHIAAFLRIRPETLSRLRSRQSSVRSAKPGAP